MQTFKIILGVLIAISLILATVEELSNVSGLAEGIGIFIGFLLMSGLVYWLINSGLKGMRKRK